MVLMTMSGKGSNDRIRTKPFTEEEKSILFEVIKAELNIIENKKTDASNSIKKHQAWERVAEKFRTSSQTHNRTAAQLKKCWENAKARRRKAEALAQQKVVEVTAESTVGSSDRGVDISLLLPLFHQQQGNGDYDGAPDSDVVKKELHRSDGEGDSDREGVKNVECIIDDEGEETSSNNHYNILPRILASDSLPRTGRTGSVKDGILDSNIQDRLGLSDDSIANTFQHQKDLHELRVRQYQLINSTAERELATAAAESERREVLHSIAVRKAEAEEGRVKELHEIAVRSAEEELLHRRRMNELEYQHRKSLMELELGRKISSDYGIK